MEILNSKEKILIIQTAFPGDAILTLPMIQKLKEKYAESVIDVLCIPSTKEIFLNSSAVDNVIVYDKKSGQKSFRDLLMLIKKIQKKNYSKIYSPHRSFRSSIIVWLSKCKETYGFDNAALSFIYKHKIHYDKNKHEVERNLKLIKYDTSKNNWRIYPEIKFTEEIENKVEKLIQSITKKIIAVAPGSVWNTKVYPEEYYKLLVDYLISKNYYIFFIGGKDDQILCERLNKKFEENSFSLAGKLSIVETIAFLKKCSLLICNDSAPTHMAMAAQIPALTIYCSTVPEFGFYPYNSISDFISYDGLKCKPCGIHGHKKCPINTFDCGYLLTPDMVIEKVNNMLSAKKKSI